MKRLKKITLWVLGILIVAVGGFMAYALLMFPKVSEAKDIKIEYTPEMIARGEYLANHVAACMDCHSVRDWSILTAPPKPGTAGAGGDKFDRNMGFPGEFYAANITPHNLKDWTDGEIFRAITTGVKKDGEPMFPVMPYGQYSNMAEEDVYAIIAYIRSLKPIESTTPESTFDFPVNLFIRFAPKDYEPKVKPAESDKVAYGKYIFHQAACDDCHTQNVKGKKIVELELAGGFEFKFPNGSIVRSANITPDMETGIGSWSEDMFVQRFKMYADSNYKLQTVGPNEFNSVMPWIPYSGMKETDLRALFAYLKSQPAITNKVVKYTAAAN